jgi:hypothetical protein
MSDKISIVWNITIPTVAVRRSQGTALRAMIDSGGVTVSFPIVMSPSPLLSPENMLYLSSRGPVEGDRIKPEVVAVGDVVYSARSDGNTSTFQCNRTDGVPWDPAELVERAVRERSDFEANTFINGG